MFLYFSSRRKIWGRCKEIEITCINISVIPNTDKTDRCSLYSIILTENILRGGSVQQYEKRKGTHVKQVSAEKKDVFENQQLFFA